MIPEFLVNECLIYTVTPDFPRKAEKVEGISLARSEG